MQTRVFRIAASKSLGEGGVRYLSPNVILLSCPTLVSNFPPHSDESESGFLEGFKVRRLSEEHKFSLIFPISSDTLVPKSGTKVIARMWRKICSVSECIILNESSKCYAQRSSDVPFHMC